MVLNIPDFSPQLQSLMEAVGIASYRDLAQRAGVAELQILRLVRGLGLQTRVEILLKISQALQISLTELLATFAPGSVELKTETTVPAEQLVEEYRQLQAQLDRQRDTLMQEFQQSSLQTLESWMLQWPTAAAKAKENEQLSATKLLPLVKPIEQLLQQWGIEAIAPVGTEVPYNPQQHQLMEGRVEPGEIVKVRYAGYRQGDKLLYRAKVSPIS